MALGSALRADNTKQHGFIPPTLSTMRSLFCYVIYLLYSDIFYY